ncbi:restriction endonuclease subunit S [Marinobacter sp. SS13-12]|uniref:restriction endonuclease subunit S n=1 Tax=Marinobacter sp. SS13-12 TaxID=3050451 RepID=UPI002554A842|nr:restriction endonuclease subunit S [Marinobacter sp. SS13-12]MDK8463176.1 restriction endonuclease subunit S [Marinobacter sp. SS13-12]
MSARELITEHLDLWTGAVTKKSNSGRGSNGKVELTGVKKLRELILELAVRGMLVEQAPNEAPASVLLDDILEERKRLANEGHIRGHKCPPATELNRLPAKLPDGWAGATLSHLGVFSGGKTPSKSRSEFWNGDIPWVTPKDMKSAEISASEDHVTQDALNAGGLALLPENAVLFVVRSGILRRMFPTAVTRVQCTINQDLKALRLFKPEMARYIQVLSWGFERFILEKLTKTGTTVESLKFSDFANQPFPLPPLEEQHRIVQKVDELMALCDRLEQQTGDQLEAHETLVDTLLGTLTQSENATELADNWARLAAHFDTLFTTEQSIDKLKQTILQLAVMGRLVEQDGGDEPATELLKRIQDGKDQLSQSSKQRKAKPLPPISESEEPFSLPSGWTLSRLDDITDIQGGIAKGKKGSGKKTHTLPYLRVANVQRSSLDLSEIKEIEIAEDEVERYLVRRRDLLITEGGDWDKVGRTAIWDGSIKPMAHQNHVFRARLILAEQNERWLERYLNSQFARNYFAGSSKQTTNLASINKTQLRSCTVPLPPLAEQNRIVQKVEELMALCDQLKERLNKASQTKSQLAEAVVEKSLG